MLRKCDYLLRSTLRYTLLATVYHNIFTFYYNHETGSTITWSVIWRGRHVHFECAFRHVPLGHASRHAHELITGYIDAHIWQCVAQTHSHLAHACTPDRHFEFYNANANSILNLRRKELINPRSKLLSITVYYLNYTPWDGKKLQVNAPPRTIFDTLDLNRTSHTLPKMPNHMLFIVPVVVAVVTMCRALGPPPVQLLSRSSCACYSCGHSCQYCLAWWWGRFALMCMFRHLPNTFRIFTQRFSQVRQIWLVTNCDTAD